MKRTKLFSSEKCTVRFLYCQGEVVEKVETAPEVIYPLTEEGSVDEAVRERINKAWLKWRDSAGILRERRCSGHSNACYTEQ